MIRNIALFVYKAFQLRTKSNKWCCSLSGTPGRGSGDSGGCLGWIMQVLRGRSRGALWCGWGFSGCTWDFLVSASRGVGAGCSPQRLLSFLGASCIICSGFAGGMWVLVSPMIPGCATGCLPGCWRRCLCCWSPAVVAIFGFSARRFWKDSTDWNSLILLFTYIRLVMLMPNAMKFNSQTNVFFLLIF